MPHFRGALSAIAMLVAAQVCPADDYSIGFTGDVRFNVIDGVPYVFHRGEGPPGNAVDIRGGSLIHYASGKELVYPRREQPSPVITLGETDETSGSWKYSGGRSGTIRADDGFYKGWYLEYGKEELKVKFAGGELLGRRLILVKDPKEPRVFGRYEVSK